MSTVGLVFHKRRTEASDAAAELRRELTERSIACLELEDPSSAPSDAQVDLVVSYGGDGTFLRAAHVAAMLDCPIMGVKVGRLGFLTEYEPDEALAGVLRMLEGQAVVEDRLTVVAEPDDGASDFHPLWGMNEITVEKQSRHRLVHLRVEIDGAYVATLSADGVILATPTGSTAYSFSAGGPIVDPEVPCLVLTPIAPHMVFDRSMVLGAQQQVLLEVVGEVGAVLSADGRESVVVPSGTRICIKASDRYLRLVRKGGDPTFLSRVRDKFGLPGNPDRSAEPTFRLRS